MHKVAWTTCCLPLNEGGLGITSIEEQIQVSLLRQIWEIVSGRESVWTRWVKDILIKKKNFWQLKIPSNSSWSWRHILKHRDLARPLIKTKIGNGEHTYLWHDWWVSSQPLSAVLNEYSNINHIHEDGARVRDIINNGRWSLDDLIIPNDLKTEILHTNIQVDQQDQVIWQQTNSNRFVAKEVRDMIRGRGNPGQYSNFIWFNGHIPRCSFISWLAMHNRLPTLSRIKKWNNRLNSTCVLCRVDEETRDHLFYNCHYSRQIWDECLRRTCTVNTGICWDDVVAIMQQLGNGRSFRRYMLKLVWTVSIYRIWLERNRRLHGGESRPWKMTLESIRRDVVGRCLTYQWRTMLAVNIDICQNWNLPNFDLECL